MDYVAPPTYDASHINLWKFKMSEYLKALGLYVYLATTKKSYFGNDKYIEANAQAMNLFDFSLWSAFTVWNTLTSPKE